LLQDVRITPLATENNTKEGKKQRKAEEYQSKKQKYSITMII